MAATLLPPSFMTDESPLDGLVDEIGDNLYIIELGPTKHLMFHAKVAGEEVNGLACFSSEGEASSFVAVYWKQYFNTVKILNVSKDEAISIASTKPDVNCIMLCDNPNKPILFFFR